MMDQILMTVMAAGVVLGGFDHILGNKLGFGKQFERGFMLLGPMALSMAGMICLAPVLANIFGQVTGAFYRLTGVDPAMFGSLLAIDMGGYQLAKALAFSPQIGSYAGLVVSAIFGCTLVFTIPVGMGILSPADRPLFARGIMLGLATMPVGLVIGGLLCGLTLPVCLHQNLPIFLLALFLSLGLKNAPGQMVRGFCVLAGGIKTVITAGLILAAVEYLTGWNPLPGMAPIGKAMEVTSSIGVVMLGSLPMAELLHRILERPFSRLGSRLNIMPQPLTGMLISLATPLPTLSMYHDMDEQGKVMAGAFLVSGTSLLAAHMGFAAGTEPQLLSALAAGKLTGALSAVILTLWLQHRNNWSVSI